MMGTRPCPYTSIGIADNEQFGAYGSSSRSRTNEDRWYSGEHHGVQLCMVLDGHDGEMAADFACKALAEKLLHGDLHDTGDSAVKSALKRAFLDTETDFFVSVDDAVIRRQTLVEEINVSE